MIKMLDSLRIAIDAHPVVRPEDRSQILVRNFKNSRVTDHRPAPRAIQPAILGMRVTPLLIDSQSRLTVAAVILTPVPEHLFSMRLKPPATILGGPLSTAVGRVPPTMRIPAVALDRTAPSVHSPVRHISAALRASRLTRDPLFRRHPPVPVRSPVGARTILPTVRDFHPALQAMRRLSLSLSLRPLEPLTTSPRTILGFAVPADYLSAAIKAQPLAIHYPVIPYFLMPLLAASKTSWLYASSALAQH